MIEILFRNSKTGEIENLFSITALKQIQNYVNKKRTKNEE